MKVLWFSVAPVSLQASDNTGIEGKGWIASLLQIALNIKDLEIVVAYGNYSPEKKNIEDGGRLKIVPINICRYTKRQIIKDMTTYKEVDDFVIEESARIVAEYQPDLIHVFGSEWCYGLLVNRVNIPMVIHMQGFWSQIRNCLLLPGQSAFFDRFRFDLLTHPLAFFARYHYYNLCLERSQREEDIIKANRYFMCRTRWDKSVVRFYNADAKVFHVDEALRPEFISANKKWSRQPKGKTIVISTTGACYSIKGPDVVLKAAKLIKEKTDFQVLWKWIGGTEEDMKEIQKQVKIKAQEVGIQMMGNLSATELIEELLASEIYVHTSYSDNSPNAVCEAQYLGLPVIATDTGGVPSLFSEDYDRNMLVPINDPYLLASKIIELHKDPDKAKILSEKNWEVAHKRHNPVRIQKQLDDTYKEVIKLSS